MYCVTMLTEALTVYLCIIIESICDVIVKVCSIPNEGFLFLCFGNSVKDLHVLHRRIILHFDCLSLENVTAKNSLS